MPYRLLVVEGLVEPFLSSETAEDWREFERFLEEFFREGKYDDSEDAIFFVELDEQGRLKDIGAFTGGFVDEMRERARSPKSWRPKRKK